MVPSELEDVFDAHRVAVAYLFGSAAGSARRPSIWPAVERGTLWFSVDEPRRVRFEVDARLRWIEFPPSGAGDHGVVPAPGGEIGPALMVDPDRVRRLLSTLERGPMLIPTADRRTRRYASRVMIKQL